MSRKGNKLCSAGLVLVLVGVMAAGCKGVSQAAPTASPGSVYTSKTLTTSYTGALDASSQLMLGMLKLEGTDKAVTVEQAKSMLAALQALQGQVFKADAERNAVWASVEKQLTPAQLSAIADMHLTQDDAQAWMKDNPMGTGPQGMPGGAGPQGTPPAGMGQGGARPQGTPLAGMGQGGARSQGMPGARQGGTGPQGGAGAPLGMGASGAGATSGPSSILSPALVRLLMQKTGGDQAPPAKP